MEGLKSSAPVPVSAVLFGSRASGDVIRMRVEMRSRWVGGCPKSNHWCSPVGDEGPCEDRDRGWADVSRSQGSPRPKGNVGSWGRGKAQTPHPPGASRKTGLLAPRL